MPSLELVSLDVHDLRSQAWAEKVQQGLMQFNQSKHGFDFAPLCVFAIANGEFLGGLIGTTGWSWLNIDMLFVEERARRQGVAKALLEMAEYKASMLGCIGAYVDTFDFQAPLFYETQGFRCFGVLDDMPPGRRRFYLKKQFEQFEKDRQEPSDAA